jgi:uncharacterized membrane protein
MKPGDTQLEIVIGRLLRVGVVLSTACLTVGLALAFLRPDGSPLLLRIGILLLIGTPAARVLLSTIEYIIARDWTFAALTSIVLLELVGGAVAAFLFHRKV